MEIWRIKSQKNENFEKIPMDRRDNIQLETSSELLDDYLLDSQR